MTTRHSVASSTIGGEAIGRQAETSEISEEQAMDNIFGGAKFIGEAVGEMPVISEDIGAFKLNLRELERKRDNWTSAGVVLMRTLRL